MKSKKEKKARSKTFLQMRRDSGTAETLEAPIPPPEEPVEEPALEEVNPYMPEIYDIAIYEYHQPETRYIPASHTYIHRN